jgi:ankyrin repeat protein
LAAKEGRLNSLKKLIAADVDLHYCDPITGEYALHIAAQYGQVEIARLLIAAGVDVNAKCSKFGNTALHKSAIYSQVGVATLLLKQKASLDRVNDMGRTPLCIAVKVGAENLCWVHLVSGADPNFCDMFLLDFQP